MVVLEYQWKMRGTKVWVWCVILLLCFAFFQKWLVIYGCYVWKLVCWPGLSEKSSLKQLALLWPPTQLITTLWSQILSLKNLHTRFLHSSWVVGRVLLEYILSFGGCMIFTNPMILTMLATVLKIWCAELKGVLAETGSSFFHFFPNPVVHLFLWVCSVPSLKDILRHTVLY